MRQVVWAHLARDDYLKILRHIAEDDPDAAERVAVRIEALETHWWKLDRASGTCCRPI